MGSYIVIRIRGIPDVKYDVKEALKRLHLVRKFHATIVPDTNSFKGMLFKVKDYVTYGPGNPDIIKELLMKRGRLIGDKPVTEEYIKKVTNLSLDELAKKLSSGEITLNNIKGLKPVFRLKPPVGGFRKSTKKLISGGGELGFREDIDKLVLRML